MPLVVLCGFPCSGKSGRAKELAEYLAAGAFGVRKVHTVGEEGWGCSGTECMQAPRHQEHFHELQRVTDYKPAIMGQVRVGKMPVCHDSLKERELRGTLRAEVERKLNKEDVVILDSLNYIKGYRYELYCLIKHIQTPHCLIYCVTAPEVSSGWNSKREPENRYTQEIFDALVQRFEAPDSRNRWDSPLFTVQKDDTLPLEDICNAIFHRKAPVPNQSTQTQPLSSTNYLHELDKVTQDVVMAILNAQKTSVPGDVIAVPGANEKIELTRTLGIAELRKLRHQFISYTKLHPNENISQLANMFVQYLNKSTH